MAISVQNLIKEKKFPFIFAFFVLLLCATSFLYTTDSRFPSFSLYDIQKQTNPSSFQLFSPPQIVTPPPVAAVSSPTTATTTADRNDVANGNGNKSNEGNSVVVGGGGMEGIEKIQWALCKGTVAVDYIPCLDNFKAIKALHSRRHMEHRERHCPKPNPRCLPPLPKGYKVPLLWPKSRDMVRL